VVSCAALLAAGALAALILLPALLGLRSYAIMSGSMTGTYGRGSLVLDEIVPTAGLRKGDVITYRPPPSAGVDHLVTHRIVAISRGRVYRTRGDANPVADPWRFELHDPRQARVRWGVPYAGYAVAALHDRALRLWLLGVPAVLIAVGSVGSLWRRLGREAAPA
jgi:signal peptidase